MFKLRLLERLIDLPYEYFVWLDPDNYFVRHPGDMKGLIRDEKLWVSMECDLSSPKVIKDDWWGMFIRPMGHRPLPADVLSPTLPEIFRQYGCTTFYNTNAGMFVVRRDAIREVLDRGFEIYRHLRWLGFRNVTEEPVLAILGQTIVGSFEKNTFEHHKAVWTSDWILASTRRGLPHGSPFRHEAWASGEYLGNVNPAIVHVMGNKTLMMRREPPVQIKEPVGTKLHEVLEECGVRPPANCRCREMRDQMDRWGVDGCQRHRSEILKHLDVASKETSWVDWTRVAAKGYFSSASILDEAVRRAA
jgi:hypothetical protein